jgi:hypothetical protein
MVLSCVGNNCFQRIRWFQFKNGLDFEWFHSYEEETIETQRHVLTISKDICHLVYRNSFLLETQFHSTYYLNIELLKLLEKISVNNRTYIHI